MTVSEIKELIGALDASGVTSLEYKENDVKLVLAKGNVIVSEAAAVPAAPAASPKENSVPAAATEEGHVIASPLVGTAYLAPAEDAEVFVKVGDMVKKGQTLAIIEAMKLMNEIESEYDGEVVQILVENEETVEYGQPLFVIR